MYRRTTDRTGVAIAAALAGVVLVVGCSSPKGPAGVVVDRDRDVKIKTKTDSKGRVKTESKVTYELTTSVDGKETEFKVSSKIYARCQVNEAYPACAK